MRILVEASKHLDKKCKEVVLQHKRKLQEEEILEEDINFGNSEQQQCDKCKEVIKYYRQKRKCEECKELRKYYQVQEEEYDNAIIVKYLEAHATEISEEDDMGYENFEPQCEIQQIREILKIITRQCQKIIKEIDEEI